MSLFSKTKKIDPRQELQKQILATEREYKSGLNTLRDLIAPSAIRINPNNIEVSGKLARSFFVISYPRYISVNWLAPIISLDAAMDMSMFIYPMDTAEIMKKLRNKVGQIQSSIAMGQEKGNVRDPMLETAYQDVEGLRNRLQQGTERYFRFSIYFTIYADNLKELNDVSKGLESVLGSKLIITKPATLQMEQGFNSTLPLGNDELEIATNLNTEPLSTTFPFVSSELTSNDGILYGINRHNNSLILFDRFRMENANSVVFAKSGAGKSYAVKLEILRSMMLGTDVIVIDPESEYKHLSEAVGGAYLNISLNSDSRVNPFDLPRGIEGESSEDILRAAVISVLGLMNLMLGKLDPTEESIMDRAIWETYAKKDITPNNSLANAEPPLMQDLVEILGGMVGGESLAQRLTKYIQGTFSGIFNQPTNINMDNQLVVFSIRDLEDSLRPTAIYVILNYIWNVVRSQLKKRILVIDEAWWMMQHDDSAKFLFGIAKRARKYYLGVSTITQDVSDFLQSPYGKPIVTNSSIQLLLKQSPAAIDLVAKTFFLTEGEKYLLLESDIGEGIFFAGLKHVAVKIIASYMEDQIITTDPKRALEIQQAKKELQAEGSKTEG
jgi:conjugal transfer ATP-binding protein TraC